ncbi:MAG: hypothetical protein JTT11_08990 [Candidatus Brockarchaeota archaeon]|nr:hypothetical protein [Candidatus Brockarchaeota archaeon]
MTDVRALNEEGIRQFGAYIDRLTGGAEESPPLFLLTDPATSLAVHGHGQVDKRNFMNRLEAARYLSGALKNVDRQEIDTNHGLWSWLALFYFDQLCPPLADGTRKPYEKYRYILPKLDSDEHFRHYYRHLLAGPFRIYRLHGPDARILLAPPVHKHGEFSEQLASRMEFITNKELIKAVNALYYDATKGTPKRGATTRNKPGTLRRFIAVIQHLELTYDLYSLNWQQILSLLPAEFDTWRTARA